MSRLCFTLVMAAASAGFRCGALAQAESPQKLPYPVAESPPPAIYSIDPVSGAAGTALTIIGFSFTASNTVMFGDTPIQNVPIAWWAGVNCVQGKPECHPGINQALVVTVPVGVAPGRHDIYVRNTNGMSNAVTFAVLNRTP